MLRDVGPVALAAAAAAAVLVAAHLRRAAESTHQHADAAVSCAACDMKAVQTDDDWLALAHRQRTERKSLPSQSSFRVCAVVVYCVDGNSELHHVVGHNDEACNLNNSCCAERAAFLQLAGRLADISVCSVYLVSDAEEPITPGALCREYMLSSRSTTPKTRVVLEGCGGAATRTTRTLAELWPHPSIYTRRARAEQLAAGERVGQRAMSRAFRLDATAERAWSAAVAASAGDARAELHPLAFGAAVVFDDGSEAKASQRKALEYGCSLDAVCQLAPYIESRAGTAAPLVIAMADQFGVCHAPFAPARAYLAEHGYGAVRVLTHDELGVLHAPTAAELMPGLPKWTQ
jgi:cytidine deaminase